MVDGDTVILSQASTIRKACELIMKGDSIYHEANLLHGILREREGQIIKMKRISANDSTTISELKESNIQQASVIVQKDKEVVRAKQNGYLYAAVPLFLLILSLI